ncbi:MAG: tRNA (N6-threonylcarbamoyladenosine(37)-N6)-methyltransferase TrmO [Clostridiaceae bacterium]|nr:tRNA (N6-threonylcarbamoyladenosine(37)-N6)-methyltransferase TrmO [Clostridiaceae bacterium]
MAAHISLEPIGVIRSEFYDVKNMPIQPTGENASKGKIEIFSQYIEGLRDLDGFSHLIVIYHFHKANQVKLTVKPFLDENTHGVFATRTPVRPNHIGMSIVEISKIIENEIFLRNIDMLDGTPILDIKPFVPGFDIPKSNIKIGWLTSNIDNVSTKLSDDRFKEDI